jgi:DNA-binding NarL/FixJ family response regulator
MNAQAPNAREQLVAVIADRSAHFRETLRRVLDQSHRATVAGEAGTLRDALRLVRRTGARLVLLDIQLVMDQPASRLRRIADKLPAVTVIVLLDDDLPEYRLAIAERWGYLCISKESAASELPQAIRVLLAGHNPRRPPAYGGLPSGQTVSTSRE